MFDFEKIENGLGSKIEEVITISDIKDAIENDKFAVRGEHPFTPLYFLLDMSPEESDAWIKKALKEWEAQKEMLLAFSPDNVYQTVESSAPIWKVLTVKMLRKAQQKSKKREKSETPI